MQGEVQLLFISPESIINSPYYRKMLLSTTYKSKLVAVVIVVDEAHCVKMNFRMAFAQIQSRLCDHPQKMLVVECLQSRYCQLPHDNCL